MRSLRKISSATAASKDLETFPDPANTQSYNRFSYANNNPVTRVDPTGFDDFNGCESSDPICDKPTVLPQVDVCGPAGCPRGNWDISTSFYFQNLYLGGIPDQPFAGGGKTSSNSAPGQSPSGAVPCLPGVQCRVNTPQNPAQTGQSPMQCRASLEKWVQAGAGAAGGAAGGFLVAGPGGALAGLAAGGVTGFASGYLSGSGAPDAFTAAATAPVGYVSTAFASEAFAGGATFSGAMFGAYGGAVGAVVPGAAGAGSSVAVATIDSSSALFDTGIVGIAAGVTAYITYQALDAAANSYCGIN